MVTCHLNEERQSHMTCHMTTYACTYHVTDREPNKYCKNTVKLGKYMWSVTPLNGLKLSHMSCCLVTVRWKASQ